jgi:uncharacterized protein YegL
MLKSKLNVVVVLDRSGSMQGSEHAAVGALNHYFASLRDDATCDAFVTLLMFDSLSIDTVFSAVPCAHAHFGIEQFQPRGTTPLLDAVGAGVNVLDRLVADQELAALVVVTDGHENASRHYTFQKINELLTHRQKEKKWLVLFLGADIDAWAQGHALGMHAGRSMSIDRARMADAMDVVGAATRRYTSMGDPVAADFSVAERKRVQGKPHPPKRWWR